MGKQDKFPRLGLSERPFLVREKGNFLRQPYGQRLPPGLLLHGRGVQFCGWVLRPGAQLPVLAFKMFPRRNATCVLEIRVC